MNGVFSSCIADNNTSQAFRTYGFQALGPGYNCSFINCQANGNTALSDCNGFVLFEFFNGELDGCTANANISGGIITDTTTGAKGFAFVNTGIVNARNCIAKNQYVVSATAIGQTYTMTSLKRQEQHVAFH